MWDWSYNIPRRGVINSGRRTQAEEREAKGNFMEDRAYDVLRGKRGKIKGSYVDPAWLAGELLAAKIIGNTDFQKASNRRVVADERLGELVDTVMRNGAPMVFQIFVSILFKEDHVKWLGEELKGMITNSVFGKTPVKVCLHILG